MRYFRRNCHFAKETLTDWSIQNTYLQKPLYDMPSRNSRKLPRETKPDRKWEIPKDFPEQNPNPILRYNQNLDLAYANAAARNLIESCDFKSRHHLIEQELRKVFASSKPTRISHAIDDRTFAFHFLKSPETDFVNVFLHDISEEIQMRRYFQVLSQFSAALLSGRSDQEVGRILAREVIHRLGYVDAMIYLYDESREMLLPVAGHGPDQPRNLDVSPGREIPLGQGIVGTAARKKETVISNDLESDPRYLVDDGNRASEISVPILNGDELLGVIDSEHPEKNHFTDTDRSILEAVANLATTRLLEIRADKRRRKTQLQFETFVQNAFGGLYILKDEKFTFVNEPMCEILGYTKEELTDPNFNAGDLMTDFNRDFRRVVLDRRRGDHSRKSYQMKIRTKTGESKYLAINTSVLLDDDGMHTYGIALDITEWVHDKKRLEELYNALESRNEELNDFVDLASHNLRAPVTNLEGLLEFYNYEDPGDPINLQLITDFRNSVAKMHLILEEMHTVLNVKSTGLFKFGTVDLDKSLMTVKKMLQNQIESSGIDIETDFTVQKFRYVEGHVRDILMNMISNAIKFKHPDRNANLKISTEKTNKGVRLYFKDNGLGLNSEQVGNKIYKLYARFHPETDGRGIGLHLVKKQLELLEGDIRFRSEQGKGATFIVELK